MKENREWKFPFVKAIFQCYSQMLVEYIVSD